MTTLLFPGRHLLHTTFQADYLRRVLRQPLAELPFLEAHQPPNGAPIDRVVFAVTSSNQANSRYNPIPFHVRAIGVDRFARPLEATLGIHYRIIGIPHFRPTPRFAEFTLKEIAAQTEGRLVLSPQNCIVLSSTPAVIAQYQALGFAILPAELGQTPSPLLPLALLERLAAAGNRWPTDPLLRQHLSPTTLDLWQDFPDVPRRVQRLWQDPLLQEQGGLTADRDYAAYVAGMSNPDVIRLKYEDIREAILPGKIVDEGCADGALLVLVARDFPDSDLIGIDLAAEFFARCRERQRAGDFGGNFVFFHQRNITRPLFADNTIQTTICNSTLHELWSYGRQAASIQAYLALKYAQTAPGGRLLIRDVVGPEDREREVLMWLDDTDGRASDDATLPPVDDSAALAEYLAGLSTYARFQRFAGDFLRDIRPGAGITYREVIVDGRRLVRLSLQAAVEFMTKKDYLASWLSEMREEFAFWSFSDWRRAVTAAGFSVVAASDHPGRGSRVYTNPWIVSHRWRGQVALHTPVEDGYRPRLWPVTNIVLVAEKR